MQLSTLPASSGSLAMYLSEINQYPLLTQEEEQELARRFRKNGDEQDYLVTITVIPGAPSSWTRWT